MGCTVARVSDIPDYRTIPIIFQVSVELLQNYVFSFASSTFLYSSFEVIMAQTKSNILHVQYYENVIHSSETLPFMLYFLLNFLVCVPVQESKKYRLKRK